jgi:hypothetical protein
MTCTKCGADKSENDFHWRNKARGWRRAWCKTCVSSYNTGYYASSKTRGEQVKNRRRADRKRNKQYVQEYLATHGCVDCPETDPTCLDFDHVRGEKIAEISQMVRGSFSLEMILHEIEKCDVRCANCHRKITAKRRLAGRVGIEPTYSGFSGPR